MQIRIPPVEEIIDRWTEISRMLKRATDRTKGCYVPGDVLSEIVHGKAGIWLIEDDGKLIGQAAGRIIDHPRSKAVLVSFISGMRLAEWWPLFVDEMDRIGREQGCAAIYAFGRPGWVRFWKQRGVATKIASEIIVRELS